jgi:hypothetical protein
MVDPRLREWATAAQARYLDAIERHGSAKAAAQQLGINIRTLRRGMESLKRAAARAGYSPDHDMTRPAPAGFEVKGVSTLYGPAGDVKAQWVKTRLEDDRRMEALREAVSVMADEIRGAAKPVAPPRRTAEQLMTVYPMGDPHIGMYAWAKECGEDFDCDIARRNLTSATSRLVGCAPASDTALIVNLGDFFHADNYSNTTQRSGNALDVDTRWPRVLSIGILAMRDCIDAALQKHQRVEVICAAGNHDDHSSVMLSMCLAAFYEREPRVAVEPTFSKFHYRRFGLSLVGVTHGDTVKLSDLGGIMATDRPEDWGATRHRYWYTGHIHHKSRLELPGCTVESFRTLAAKDSYHTAHGYRAGRDMECIVLDRDYGEIERHRVDIAALA